jgi:transcriptional regulator with GAF, ATPase, and Fis domain
MTQYAEDTTTRHWLARITPEVLVAVEPGAPPRIAEVSPKVALWTGSAPDDLIGRTLSQGFEHVIPGLTVVVDEVCTSGAPIRDYRLAFIDAAGTERTIVLQASLKPDRSALGQRFVLLQMEEVSAQRELAEAAPEVDVVHGMVGHSAALRRVLHKIEMYGPTEASVLITGETGTGKELAARAIHTCSRRRHQPFLGVNCSTLSGDLLESELFGHEKGAFTGAHRTHRGRFERAHGGTLFLDEIGEMPLPAQAKLLRVLEEGRIERVGGERQLEVDVRLVSATNVPLEWAVQNKTFRLDLYHRLEVLRLHMPALRERPEDIPSLVAYFLRQFDQTYERHVRRLTPEALRLLQQYAWPGNIRELRNVLERVYVESTTEVIGRKAFEEWQHERTQFFPGAWNVAARDDALAARPVFITPYPAASPASRPLLPHTRETEPAIDLAATSVQDLSPHTWEYVAPSRSAPPTSQRLTRERITAAYARAAGNMTQAARALGVHKATLYRHIKALGMSRDDLDAAVARNDAGKDD